MAYTKKKWVNVPDPSNPPSIPEGQGALARFDADNMNRIEDGIADALNYNDHTPTYTEATTLTTLTSGEKLSIAFGKIKRAITDLISHIADTTKHNHSVAGGGAIGIDATTGNNSGGAVGYKATTGGGGAVGDKAKSNSGGGIGYLAESSNGGAIGEEAKSNNGGAIGYMAKTSNGCAIGHMAKTINQDGTAIDAIQLGTGTNEKEKTLQIYDYTLMNADGSVPNQRMFTLIKTVDINLSAPKGVVSNTVNITGIDLKKYSELEFMFNGTVSLYWHYEKTLEGHTVIKLYIGDCTLCETWQEVSGVKILNTNFPVVSNLNLRYSGFTYLISNLDSSLNPTTPTGRFTGDYVSQNGDKATTETGDFIFKITSGSDHAYMDDYNISVVGTLYIYGKEFVE